MSKGFVANKRSEEEYSKQLAADVFYSTLNQESAHNFLSICGPFIGSDWLKVSYHHVCSFFRKLIFPNNNYLHSNKYWKLLAGPSSEVLFDPWEKHLESKGVKFVYNTSIKKLDINDNKITSATVVNNLTNETYTVNSDIYVVATSPFAVADIVKNSSPEIGQIQELNKMTEVIIGGPHVQIAFFIAFSDIIKFPSSQYAIILRDSPYNITMTAVEQFWLSDISLGKDVKSLWTCTACVSSIKGLNGKSAEYCTKEEFINEVLNEIRNSKNLENILKNSNDGKGFNDFNMINIDVWNEWTFDPNKGIEGKQPKWVNSNLNQQYRSKQDTTVPNLFLAGAHTITDADIWSIEGAAESGKRVSKLITKESFISTDYKPVFIQILNKIDDILYDAKLPNVIDVLLIIIIMMIIIFVISNIMKL
jgi:hypothetical protein